MVVKIKKIIRKDKNYTGSKINEVFTVDGYFIVRKFTEELKTNVDNVCQNLP